LHGADHVIYQSLFCKLAADTFLGPRTQAWEVLHNPVDTRVFTPAAGRSSRPLTMLLGGSQYQRYKVERALDTLVTLRRERPDARLVIAGALSYAADARAETSALVATRGLHDAVELTGPYTQVDAPPLFRCADVLLHPKYNDPCPTVVLEAMACGLPVVYSASGADAHRRPRDRARRRDPPEAQAHALSRFLRRPRSARRGRARRRIG
jgi:glycosyltransferase involved in cell wall biosynthesis